MTSSSSNPALSAESNDGISLPVIFSTQTPYPLPSQKFMIPASWKRYQLSQLINKALSLSKPVPFDFLIKGELLRTTLAEWCTERGVGEEETLEIEYIESVLPPQRTSEIPHEDWVSSVICHFQGHFLTASYDGCIRAFDYSRKLSASKRIHSAPITSICFIPSFPSESDPDSYTIASASHDLSAQLIRFDLSAVQDEEPLNNVHPLTTLHLHTGPLSSISASPCGTHLLTSSWDGLIGFWDTTVPTSDQVPEDQVSDRKHKKRKVEEADRPKRKAPVSVLKSHAARVSKVVFGHEESGGRRMACSCGFDSTVRTWDTESGICTNTITSPEKPFLDVALTADGQTAVAASTDRTVTLFDVRSSNASQSLSATIGRLIHQATPSCIALSPSNSSQQQIATGAFDGIVRIWDMRSLKSPVTSFKAWAGKEEGKKVLALDWANGIMGVGGEGGFEIWRIGEEVHTSS